MNRRKLGAFASALALVALGGCASWNQLTSEVSSFGQWPAGRAAGSYFIERLPSQAARPDGKQTTALEDAARAALAGVGFKPAANLESAEVIVQIGARVTRYDIAPWADPLWWRWGTRYWRAPGWAGYRHYPGSPGWLNAPPPDREVAILLRDRASSVPLWEARAVSSGLSADAADFQAMFTAALSGFPVASPQPRSVTVALPPTR